MPLEEPGAAAVGRDVAVPLRDDPDGAVRDPLCDPPDELDPPVRDPPELLDELEPEEVVGLDVACPRSGSGALAVGASRTRDGSDELELPAPAPEDEDPEDPDDGGAVRGTAWPCAPAMPGAASVNAIADESRVRVDLVMVHSRGPGAGDLSVLE